MIYKLDSITGEMSRISADEARRSLTSAGWSNWNIQDFFRSAKVLSTRFFYFCRFSDRLDELAKTLTPTAPPSRLAKQAQNEARS
jgi:hypothetical protein